ncbi:hypothetical protein NHX12_028945 [Muraenolepis orangiensis]|uniref:UBA domain-containing protein n=1 Tax=Muraenolepis orangiensis TaxID=630683 RepID=A0A9Q0EB78_9TELE|nr:hypothetical protein NHX12_028945 [Muraenolepis orangiensis]
MMTSVVSSPARATRDRTLPTNTQTTQKQIQPTAEQIRMAQVFYEKDDADFEDKVKQLIEVSGKTQDECGVALHDCHEDVNRAINFLLESPSDTTSWETVGKRRSVGKEAGPSELKENKDRRGGEREASRGRGGAPRRGRGISRGRDGRSEENGFEVAPGERGGERGRRGRGRGVMVRGRGRGTPGYRFSSQGMGTFNPSDYTANSGGARQETWETEGIDGSEGTAWRGNLEDWASEDWNEDLSETKVFTASSAPENHVTPGHNVDLSSLMAKAGVPGVSVEADLGAMADAPADALGQSLVFTNSHHNGRTTTHSYAHAAGNSSSYAHAASANTYAHAALSSVLGSGFGSLSAAKPSPDVRIPEQLNGPRLGQRAGQKMVAPSSGSFVKEASLHPGHSASPSSMDVKAQRMDNGPLSAHHLELKSQPEPSAVLSQLRQLQSAVPAAEPSALLLQHAPQVPTPPGHESSLPPARDGASPGVKLPGMDPPISEPPQRQMKTQRRRVPLPSKIPSSAVEMPGSTDVSGLNVQFGALDFGSEAGAGSVDMGQAAETVREAAALPLSAPMLVPAQQSQSSLFSKPGPVSEPMSSLPTLPLSYV